MKENTSFKGLGRAGYGVSALTLALVSVGFPYGSAYAIGGTTELTSNLTLEESVAACYVIPNGATVTVDLNGNDITCADEDAFMVMPGGTLNLTGSGNVKTSAPISTPRAAIFNRGGVVNVNGGSYVSENWYTVKNLGTMTISGGTFSQGEGNASNASLVANGWYGDAATDRNVAYPDTTTAALTINGGTFDQAVTTTATIKGDDWSKTTINGGTFMSQHGELVQVSGNVDINGGNFTGFNGILWYNSDGSAAYPGVANITGGTFSADHIATSAWSHADLNITGGDFVNVGSILNSTTNDNFNHNIVGGTFNPTINTSELVPEGYRIYQGDGHNFVAKDMNVRAGISSATIRTNTQRVFGTFAADAVDESGEAMLPTFVVTKDGETADESTYSISVNTPEAGRMFFTANEPGVYQVTVSDYEAAVFTTTFTAFEVDETDENSLVGATYNVEANTELDLTEAYNATVKPTDATSIKSVTAKIGDEATTLMTEDHADGLKVRFSNAATYDVTVELDSSPAASVTFTVNVFETADARAQNIRLGTEDYTAFKATNYGNFTEAESADESIATATLDENGNLKITPVAVGSTTVSVKDATGEFVKNVPVNVYKLADYSMSISGPVRYDIEDIVEVPEGWTFTAATGRSNENVLTIVGDFIVPREVGERHVYYRLFDAEGNRVNEERGGTAVTVYVYGEATEVADQYLSISDAEGIDFAELYQDKANDASQVAYTTESEGAEIDEAGVFTATTLGEKMVTITETLAGETIATQDATVYVYGMTYPESTEVAVGVPTTISGIERFNSETYQVVSSEDVEVSLEDGEIVVTAKSAVENYELTVTNRETTAAGTTTDKAYTLKVTATVIAEVEAEMTDDEIDLYAPADNQNALLQVTTPENTVIEVETPEGIEAEDNEDGTYTITATEGVELGDYTLTVKQSLSGAELSTATVTLHVVDTTPVLTVNGGEEAVKVRDEVTFDTSESENGTVSVVVSKDGEAVEGDFEIADDGTFTFAAEEAGEYTLTFAITDLYGNEVEETVEKTITVLALNVVATVNGEEFDDRAEVRLGEDDEISFDTTGSTEGAVRMSVNGIETEEFTADTAGTYVVSFDLYYNDRVLDTRVFTVVVNPAYVLNVEATSDEEAIESGAIIALGQTITFDTEGSVGTVTVNGEAVENNVYEFTAEEEGEYEFTFALSEEEDETETFTVNVVATPSMDEVALIAKDGTYQGSVESEWSVDMVEICDETGETCEVLEEPDQDFEVQFENTGRYTVTAYHNFGEEAVALKSTLVIVYDVDEADSEDASAATLNKIADEFAGVVDTLNNLGEDATFDEIAAAMNALENAGNHLGKSFGNDPISIMNVAGAILSGETLTTEITGTDAPVEEAEVNDAAKTEIAKALAGLNISEVEYYDINAVVKNEDGEIIANLHELDSEATLAIAVDTAPDGYTRTYYVVRYHDGVAEVIAEGVVNGDQIVFKSKKFSTYAIAYSDTKNATETATAASTTPKTNKAKKAKAPNTGVATEAGASSATASAVVSSLVMASLISLIGAVKIAKKQARK